MTDVRKSVAASRARRPISIACARPAARDRRPRDTGVLVRLGEDVRLVATERLGRVHRGVGIPNERFHPELRSGPSDDADRDRHREVCVARDVEPLTLDQRAQLLREHGAFLGIRLGEDQHEFLAPVPADEVARPKVAGKDLGDATQDTVAALVPVTVVDDLEMVDVDEGYAEGPVIARRAFDLGEQLGQQRLPVVDAGQPVDGRAIVGIRERLRDPVDDAGETRLETAPASLHRDRVVAIGDPFRGTDEAPQSQPPDEEQDDRADRRPDHRAGDRDDHDELGGAGPHGHHPRHPGKQDSGDDQGGHGHGCDGTHHQSRLRSGPRPAVRPKVPMIGHGGPGASAQRPPTRLGPWRAGILQPPRSSGARPAKQEVSDRACRAHRPSREASERPHDGGPPNVRRAHAGDFQPGP